MTIEAVRRDEGKTLLLVFGEALTFSQWRDFQARCLVPQAVERVYLDLRRVAHMDLDGCGMLLLLGEHFNRLNAKVYLLPDNPQPYRGANAFGFESLPAATGPRWAAEAELALAC